MEEIFKTFSCGSRGVAPLVLQTVSRLQAKSIAHNLYQNHGALIDRIAPGMHAAVMSWVEEIDADLWNRVFSRLERVSKAESVPPYPQLVELGLAATSAARTPVEPWKFSLDRPYDIWFERFIIQDVVSGTVSQSSSRKRINLVTLRGDVIIDIGADGIVHRSSESEPSQISCFPYLQHESGKILVLTGSSVDSEIIPEYAEARFCNDVLLENFSSNVSCALDLLKTGSPKFAAWVTSVFRYVCPLKMPSDQLGSSSSPWDWGLLAITDTPYASSIAEMLVHESSHQIFFQAKRFGPIDDGSDHNSYFSPMARQNRTLERILLAYHALANIALMYLDFIENRAFDETHCQRQLDKAMPKLKHMQAVLDGNSALTELGRSIYQPLNDFVLKRAI